MVKRARPDCAVSLLRGSVGTRLDKVMSGAFDATLLALAGLKRLGLADKASCVLTTDEMLPAVGQGAIGLVIRADDEIARLAVSAVACAETFVRVTAERAMLTVLDGSCRTPIAGHATVEGGTVRLRGLVLSPDGGGHAEGEISGPLADAERLGAELGRSLRARAPAGVYN
jgi:hydroxymethylbilane synthase